MPKPQVKRAATDKKWRTVRTKDGRVLRIAIVRKKGKA